MITLSSQDPTPVLPWLETYVRPHLTLDVSHYARGRLRCWLGTEPHLGGGQARPALDISDEAWKWFEQAIGWRFDYALCTFSGAESQTGILPHRDAGYAARQAVGWNISGTCLFRYWSPDELAKEICLNPGSVIRFDCKNQHSAEPSVNRWAMNFWRAKT